MDSIYDPNLWNELLTIVGVGEVCVAEDHREAELRIVGQTTVLEEMGHHLSCSPYLSLNLFGFSCIDGNGTDEQKKQFVARISL